MIHIGLQNDRLSSSSVCYKLKKRHRDRRIDGVMNEKLVDMLRYVLVFESSMSLRSGPEVVGMLGMRGEGSEEGSKEGQLWVTAVHHSHDHMTQ